MRIIFIIVLTGVLCVSDLYGQNEMKQLNFSLGWGIKKYSSASNVFYENVIQVSKYCTDFLDVHVQFSKSFLALYVPNLKFDINNFQMNALQIGAKLYIDEILFPYMPIKLKQLSHNKEFPFSFFILLNTGVENYSSNLLQLNYIVGGGLGAEYLFTETWSIKFQNTFSYIFGNATLLNNNKFIDASNSQWMFSSFFTISYSIPSSVDLNFFNKINSSQHKIIRGKDKF